MELVARTIVDEGIEEQKNAAETQRVGEFVDGVQENVEAKVDALREQFGEQVEGIAGQAMKEAQSYGRTQLNIFDPNFKVKDTEKQGAIAWNEKGGDNSIAVGESLMDRVKNEGYAERVVKHEETHKYEQVVEYNRASISYPGDTDIAVNPVLTEWHPITMANQPDSDLTPEYREHKRRGDALVTFLGGSGRLIDALKSGDMQALQDYIDTKIVRKSLGLQDEVVEPDYVSVA